MFRKRLKDFIREKKFFFLVGILLFIIFEILLGITFWGIFNYLVNYVSGGYAFAPKMLAIIVMIVFYVILMVSFISAIPTLYKNKEVEFLLVNPIKEIDVFKYGVFKVFFYSSWGSLFVLLPSFVAFGIANMYPPSYYLFSLLVILGLTLIASFGGVLIILIIASFIFRLPKIIRNIIFLGGIIALFFGTLIKIPKLVLEKGDSGFTLLENYIFTYDYSNLLYPYNWFIKLFDFLVKGDRMAVLSYSCFILFSIIILGYLLFFIARRYYFKSIEGFENFSVLSKKKKKLKFKSIFGKNKYLNLMKKDMLIHIRDPVQWTQLLIFIVLLFVYIGVIKGMSIGNLQDPRIVTMLTLANIGITGFFISSIALRFVFPNVSLEGSSFWILRTIPVKLLGFYISKLAFFSLFLLLTGYILSFSYIKIIDILPEMEKFIYIILFPVIMVISTVFFMLGSIYPDFKEKNPSKIATSFPGMFSIFISNLYIFVLLLLLYPVILEFYNNRLDCNIENFTVFGQEILLLRGVSIVLIISLVYTGYNNFKKLET